MSAASWRADEEAETLGFQLAMTLKQWRRDLLRLNITVAVPWVLWFGYWAYDANRAYFFTRSYTEAFESLPQDRQKDLRSYADAIARRDKYKKLRDESLIWLPSVPIGYPIVTLAFFWIVAGFQRRET